MTQRGVFDLDDRVAVVPGGGGAIGSALAVALAGAGANVAIAGRSPERLEAAAETVREIGGECLALAADLTDPEACERVVAETIERFGRLDRIMGAGAAELAVVPGVGPRIAASAVRFFSDAGNRRVCRRLRAAGVRVAERVVRPTAGPLAGQTFVLTGTLAGLTREEARRLIEARGGRVADGVSKRTDVVVVGETPGQKLDTAHRLGIRTVDERRFRRLVGTEAG